MVAVKRVDNYISKGGKIRARWLFKCDCGNEKEALYDDVAFGRTMSCGCLNAELRKARSTKHGCAGTRIYTEWASMKSRCYYTKNKAYQRYGGRGIKVCEEWRNSFEKFKEWALTNGYDDNLTIERKNVNGNYCPENCCWIPLSEQAKNRRTTLKTSDEEGNEVFAMDIAKENGIPMNIVVARLHNGWGMQEALNTPIIQQTVKRKVLQVSLSTGEIIAEYKSIGQASKAIGIDRSGISRCCLGQRNKAGGYGWRYAENI